MAYCSPSQPHWPVVSYRINVPEGVVATVVTAADWMRNAEVAAAGRTVAGAPVRVSVTGRGPRRGGAVDGGGGGAIS